MRSWEELQQYEACKNVQGGRHESCPEAWPYKPRQWCGECRKAGDLRECNGPRDCVGTARGCRHC